MTESVFSIPVRPLTGPSGTRRSLREFIGSQENLLVAFATNSLESTPRRLETLVLYGPTGTGKSLLAGNLLERWNFQPANGRAVCWSGVDFARAVNNAQDTDHVDEFRQKLAQARFVIIDGVEELLKKPAAQHALSLFLDEVKELDCRVLLMMRRLPSEISGLDSRLVSRIMSGLCIPVATPGPAARRVILMRLAELHQIRFTESAMDALADGWPGLLAASSTVLEMNHVVVRLAQLATELNREIGVDHLRSCAGAPDSDLEKLQQICKEIAQTFGVRTTDLAGPSRRQGLVRARGIAMFLCRQLTPLSLEAIGTQFGGRDHTTVLHACRKAEELVAADTSIRGLVEKLSSQLAR